MPGRDRYPRPPRKRDWPMTIVGGFILAYFAFLLVLVALIASKAPQ